MSGQKMAKSARNIYRVSDLAEQGVDPLAYRLLCFGSRYRSEMEFSWEALEGSNERVTSLRKRMAEWVGEARAERLSEQAQAFDRRFRDAVADDLDMPQALVVVNEVVASGAVAGGEKYALLAAWDSVLGLDLDRLARTVTRRVSQGVDISVVVTDKMDLTDQVETLVRQRDEARRAKDFVAADDRKKLIALGFEVMDTSEGTKIRPQS